METATAFLGLCPFDWKSINLAPVHVTHITDPLGEDGLDEETEKKLRAFFLPHNQELYELIGRDLGWEAEEGKVYVGGKGGRRRRRKR